MVVSYRLSIVTIALSLTIRPQFVVKCLRRSNQQGMGHFGAKFGEEGVDRCKPNFNMIWKRHETIDIFCRLSTMHERNRQTDKQTDKQTNRQIDTERTVTSIAIDDIAIVMSSKIDQSVSDQLAGKRKKAISVTVYRLTSTSLAKQCTCKFCLQK